jgi:hypothetical protein
MGSVETIVMAIILMTSLYVVARLFLGEADNRSEPSPDSAVVTVGEEDTPNVPIGGYLDWPIPTAAGLAVLGVIGAAFGSGGSPGGFFLAWTLNPINWAMGYALFQIGKIRCPHCRRSVSMSRARNAPVGATLKCPECTNNFMKPAG